MSHFGIRLVYLFTLICMKICFQSDYMAGHNCKTYLLRVYNDIVTTVGKSNGSCLVLLNLSTAFDAIDHDNLFYILDVYVEIVGSALRLIQSYFMVIVHKELKLIVLCHILLVCCVGCHRTLFCDQCNFV